MTNLTMDDRRKRLANRMRAGYLHLDREELLEIVLEGEFEADRERINQLTDADLMFEWEGEQNEDDPELKSYAED